MFSQYLEPTPEAVSYPAEEAYMYRRRFKRWLRTGRKDPETWVYHRRKSKPKPEPEPEAEPAFDPAFAAPFEPPPPRHWPKLDSVQQQAHDAWIAKREADYADYNERMLAYEARRAIWSNEMLHWEIDGVKVSCPKPSRGIGLGTGKYLFVYADELWVLPAGSWRECARQGDVVCFTSGG